MLRGFKTNELFDVNSNLLRFIQRKQWCFESTLITTRVKCKEELSEKLAPLSSLELSSSRFLLATVHSCKQIVMTYRIKKHEIIHLHPKFTWTPKMLERLRCLVRSRFSIKWILDVGKLFSIFWYSFEQSVGKVPFSLSSHHTHHELWLLLLKNIFIKDLLRLILDLGLPWGWLLVFGSISITKSDDRWTEFSWSRAGCELAWRFAFVSFLSLLEIERERLPSDSSSLRLWLNEWFWDSTSKQSFRDSRQWWVEKWKNLWSILRGDSPSKPLFIRLI